MSNESPYATDFETLDAAYNESPGCVAPRLDTAGGSASANSLRLHPSGDLFYADLAAPAVYRMSPGGALIATLGTTYSLPSLIAIDNASEYLYVFDGETLGGGSGGPGTIYQYDENMEYTGVSFGSYSTATPHSTGEFASGTVPRFIHGIDIDANGYIFALHGFSASTNIMHHMNVFSSTGGIMPTAGTTVGFTQDYGLAISSSNYIFQGITGGSAISIFSTGTGGGAGGTVVGLYSRSIDLSSDGVFMFQAYASAGSTRRQLPTRLSVDTLALEFYFYANGSNFLVDTNDGVRTENLSRALTARGNDLYVLFQDCGVARYGTTGNFKYYAPMDSSGQDFTRLDTIWEFPYQMALDTNSTVAWITRTNANVVRKISLESTSGGVSGTSLIQISSSFNKPSGIAISTTGDAYVVDRLNHRIQVFGTTGDFKFTWGSSGTGNGEFHLPWQIALDSNDDVYITDRGNHRVQKFGTTGDYLLEWGGFGSGNGQFKHPCAIVADVSDNIWVSDLVRQNVQKFNTTGGYSLSFGAAGTSGGAVNECVGLAATTSGDIWAVDQTYHRCLRFNSTGAYQDMFGSTDATVDTQGTCSSDNYLLRPFSILVGSSGYLYVGNRGWHAIKQFNSTGVYASHGFV